MSSATKTARTRAEARIGWLYDVVAYIREYVELPKLNLPQMNLPTDFATLSDEDIEAYAVGLRRFWNLGLGPISNLVRLLERNGVIVARVELGAETLDAFSTWIGDTPFIVLGSDKDAAARSRFDAGHELGHLVLHRFVGQKILNKGPEFKAIEHQAHRFAAAFLLPADSFANEFRYPTLDAFRVLKAKWGVSIGMMIMRAEALDLVSPEQARNLWVNYSRRGWRRNEPLDNELQAEVPALLRSSLELLLSKGVQSREDILAKLPYNQRDLEELAGLPPGYLADSNDTVRYLSLRSDQNVVSPTGSKVVPFSSNTHPGRRG